MECLRCGHCCKHSWVVIVDDPEKGIVESNLIVLNGQGQACPHLIEEKPYECSCAVHDKPWYKKTPCFSHSQIERSVKSVCRLGKYILQQRAIGIQV